MKEVFSYLVLRALSSPSRLVYFPWFLYSRERQGAVHAQQITLFLPPRRNFTVEKVPIIISLAAPSVRLTTFAARYNATKLLELLSLAN